MNQLDRIERKLDSLMGHQTKPLSVRQAMELLGIRSLSAFYRLMAQKGIKAIRRGTYARKDIYFLTQG